MRYLLPIAAVATLTITVHHGLDSKQRELAAAPTPAAAQDTKSARKSPSTSYKSVLIRGVPHVRQKPDFCGEACIAMYMNKLGRRASQDDVFNISGLEPTSARGCVTRELVTAVARLGFRAGDVWYEVRAQQASQDLDSQFSSLHADLLAGHPSMVCMHYDDAPKTTEHFRLILGYDAGKDEIIYHEPAERAGAYKRMKREMFLKLWPLKYKKDRWTLIRFRLRPGRLVTPSRPAGFSNADYAQHIMKLRKRLPEGDFHVVLSPPFVVVGDESPTMVRRRASGTVAWAVKRIKKDYFPSNPKNIIDVWLFKDKQSYEKNVKAVFNDRPTTPFGYYSSYHRALIMNISTGGGTLVHEIVHPFMASNFTKCPSWFNEGLASLYEQCGDKNGKIWGYTNWRLAGLQKAVREKVVPPFKTLCSTSDAEFYDSDPGTNYAQARYLCYYLQSKGLLRKFYHAFRRNAAKDPTGYETLREILGKPDMVRFQKEWEQYVLTLRF